MKTTRTTLWACAALLLLHGPAWPQKDFKATILIDASGSMAGFFETGAMELLRRQIVTALPDISIDSCSFAYEDTSDHKGLQPYQAHPATFGSVTLLDRAFQEATEISPKPHALLLVTDNIQDPDPNAGDKKANESIKKFYSMIQGGAVVRGEFFVQVRSFQGWLYKRDGVTKVPGSPIEQPINRALIIYAMLLDTSAVAHKNFQRMINSLSASFIEKAIPFKLDQRIALKIEQLEVINPSSEKAEPGVRYLTLENGVLTHKGSPLQEGEPIIGQFRVRFRLNVPNVDIKKGKPKITSDGVENKFRLDSNSCASFEADADSIDPQLTESSASVKRQYEATVTVRFKRGVRFQISPSAFFCYLFKRDAGKFIGEIPLTISLKGLEFSLSKEVQKYNTLDTCYFEPDSGECAGKTRVLQTKIYGLNWMVEQNLRETKPFTELYKVEFRVQYPMWPAFVLLGILGLLVLGGFHWYNRQPYFELIPAANGMLTLKKVELADFDTDSPDAEKRLKNMFRLFPLFSSEPIRDARRVKAEMRRSLLVGVKVTARRGYRLVAIVDGLPQKPTTSLRLRGDYDQFKIIKAGE